MRRLDHAIELSLLPPLLRRLQLAGAAAEFAGEIYCLLHFQRHTENDVRRLLVQQMLNILPHQILFVLGS